MSRPILTVDIDEVLYPFVDRYLQQYNAERGTDYSSEELKTFFILDDLHPDRNPEDVYEEHLYQAEELGFEPMPGALNALTQLKDAYDIYVVTSRRPSMRPITEQWIGKNFPDVFSDIHFIRDADVKLTKAELCQRLGAKYLIEDHPDHVAGIEAVGTHVLLFGDLPWNRDVELPEGSRRVKDWNEVLEVLL